jgi:hypothetical protein
MGDVLSRKYIDMIWNGCRLKDIHFGGLISTPSQHLEKPIY